MSATKPLCFLCFFFDISTTKSLAIVLIHYCSDENLDTFSIVFMLVKVGTQVVIPLSRFLCPDGVTLEAPPSSIILFAFTLVLRR